MLATLSSKLLILQNQELHHRKALFVLVQINKSIEPGLSPEAMVTNLNVVAGAARPDHR